MAEVSTLLQRSQLGVEGTPGTAVPANKALTGVSVSLNPMINIGTFRPKGYKFQTLTLPGSEWVEGELEGVLTYSELPYLLASVLDTPAPATQPDGVGAPDVYEWTFQPASTTEDTPVTYTVEEGGTVRAHRATGVLVTEFGFEFQRQAEDGIELSGAVLGKKLQDGVVLTGAPTEVTAVPVLPQHFSVYLDDTDAGLGTTKLGRVLKLAVSVESRWGPLWVIDRDQDSYVATLETEPEVTCTLTVEADAAGMAQLELARTGVTRYMRLDAAGPTIPGGTAALAYGLQWDLAGKVSEVSEFSDEDGVYAMEFTWTTVHDPAWARAMQVQVRNTLAGL